MAAAGKNLFCGVACLLSPLRSGLGDTGCTPRTRQIPPPDCGTGMKKRRTEDWTEKTERAGGIARRLPISRLKCST